jgi:hypothetical protein
MDGRRPAAVAYAAAAGNRIRLTGQLARPLPASQWSYDTGRSAAFSTAVPLITGTALFRAFLERFSIPLSDTRQINRYSTHANLPEAWVILKN